jgi:anaerobic ribonucleoside-triphosphate reductase activating protein|nr:MAG TPA: 4Fe-4S single cluster domain protein [Caudoviricetes sp.]
MSNYVKIKNFSIENGEGIRTSIFFSGCDFFCRGCFNKDIQDFNVGKPFTKEVYENEIKPTINKHIAGISVLGGEPLHPKNLSATFNLLRWFKRDFPNKTIWVWSGYTLEELLSDEYMIKTPSFNMIELILENIDILVDGRFVEKEKDLTLKWRGSKNQRVISVKDTLERGEIVEYCE